MGMKQILSLHDINIILYIIAFLFQLNKNNSSCYGSVQFHLLIMGKVKIAIYCYVTTDISTKVLQKKCYLSSPLPGMQILA